MNDNYALHFDESLSRFPLPTLPPEAVLTDTGATFGGAFRFSVHGLSGYSYAVQSSTDTVNWATIATNVSPFTFTDPDATNSPQKFYRAVLAE